MHPDELRNGKDAELGSLFEYLMFGLMCACVVREVFHPLATSCPVKIEIINPLHEHKVWLEHISTARQQDILGPLRLEHRGGSLCVVGMGRCQIVQSVEEGVQVISMLKDQIAAVF